MAFEILRFVRDTAGYNAGQIATTFNPNTPTVFENGPAQFNYASATDNIAAIGAANYFADVCYMLSVNDLIFCVGSDASAFYQVATVDRDAGTITVVSAFPTGVVGTANINNLAVTTAKIDNLAVTTGKIADDAVTSAKIDPTVLQYVAVPLTAANIIAMNGAPVQVLAAGGADTVHVVEHAALLMTYNSVQFTGGGAIGLQYGNTAALAGEAASSQIAAANILGAASTGDMVEGVLSSGAFTAVVNAGLFISNLTAAFAAGNSTFVLHLWYRTIPTV